MKLTIPRGELKAATAGFSKIVNGKSHTLPILGCVRFEHNGDGLVAQATDLDQYCSYRFPDTQSEGDGSFILPFQNLKDLAKGADAETVELQTGENDEVIITNRLGAHVLTHTVAGFPVADWPLCGDNILTATADQFLPMYRRCAPFASADQTRRVLNGIHIDLEGKGERKATLVACDGRRLTCCNSLNLPIKAKGGVIVPTTKFLTWPGLGDECSIGTGTSKTTGWFCLAAGPWTYRVKLVEGVYPNWRQVLPGNQDMQHRIAFADADVLAMKQLLPTLPGNDGVALVCDPNGVVALAGRNAGDKAETVVALTADTRYTGTGERMLLNRFFLLDALAAGFRNFGFQDTCSPMRADDDKGGTHVLMPQKVGGNAPAPAPAQESTTENPAAAAAPEAAPPQPENHATSTPAVETPPPETHKEKKTMTKEGNGNGTTEQGTALDKVLSAVETAKCKLREAVGSLSEVAESVKQAVKEGKAQAGEVEKARLTLQKLQQISL